MFPGWKMLLEKKHTHSLRTMSLRQSKTKQFRLCRSNGHGLFDLGEGEADRNPLPVDLGVEKDRKPPSVDRDWDWDCDVVPGWEETLGASTTEGVPTGSRWRRAAIVMSTLGRDTERENKHKRKAMELKSHPR